MLLQTSFDNHAHNGKVGVSLDSKFSLAPCPHVNNTGQDLASRPIVILILTLDVVIIVHCSLSLLLCVRSLWRGQRLRKVICACLLLNKLAIY